MALILMVDDEEADRTLARTILEDAGHQLLFAPHGEAGLRVFKANPVDLVVTDLAMPHLNGLRLIEEVMAHDPVALVIAVTGVSPEQLDRAEQAGAAATLTKPYDPKDLLAKITEVLETRESRPPTDLWY